jgi:hypothetical protein
MMPTKNIFSDVTLMLLGPRGKLRLRHKIKTTLVDKGYAHENIIIMEDIKDDEKYLDSKFSTILDKQAPKLFFAFFHENERMHGVIFELGWICGKYKRLEISDRLRIVSRLDYDWRQTTRYIQSLFHTAQLLPIEEMNDSLISKCIHDNVINSLNINRT